MDIKLFDSELKIMNILWQEGDMAAKNIAKQQKEEVGWNVNTTYTLIKRCIKKGAIERQDPNFICHALIPKSTVWQDAELKYILAHEYAHIRRQDTLTKLIFILVLCIHWFNPMVWIMYILFNRDIKLTCDGEALSQLGESSKTSYALTLIHMEECKSNPSLLYNNFSKNSMEERYQNARLF